jgi:hypothetical protein
VLLTAAARLRALQDCGEALKSGLVNYSFPDFRSYTFFMKQVNRFLRDEQGQDLIEYTLLMAFIG